MKKIELSNSIIELPTSLNDLTLEDYIDIIKLDNNKDKYEFDELYTIDYIKKITKMNDEEIDNLTIEDFNKIVNELNEFKLDIEECDENEDESIIIDGDEYVFVNPEKLKLKDIINIKTYQKKYGDIDCLPYILCFLLKKKGKDNKLYDVCIDVVDVIVKHLLKEKISKFLRKLNFFMNLKK